MNIDTVDERLYDFCVEYGISKKHHGSLRLLAHMAYVFGYEIDFWLDKIPLAETSGGHRRSHGVE